MFLVVLFGAEEASFSKTERELPLSATVEQLSAQPELYDGHRVVVTGRIKSIELQRGRRGSEFLMLVVEDDSAVVSKTVQVFSPFMPVVTPGERVLIQGVYHLEGRQAGLTFEHFIDAEIITRDKPPAPP